IGIFSTAAIFLGMGIKSRLQPWDQLAFLKRMALLAGALSLPVVAAYSYFLARMPSVQAWSSILGYNSHWPKVVQGYFYKRMSGWDIPLDQGSILRPLPVLVIFMAGYLLIMLIRHRRDAQQTAKVLPLFIMAVWALLMLSKVFFNARIDNEG